MDAESQVLSATLSRRHQIVAMQTAERNRRGRAIPEVCNRIQAHITWLEEELKTWMTSFWGSSKAVQYGGRRTCSFAAFPV